MTSRLPYVLIFLALSVSGFSQTDILVKNQTGASVQSSLDLDITEGGSVYVVGSTFGQATFGNGVSVTGLGYDMYLVKYNGQGLAQWAQRGGSTSWADKGASVDVGPYGELYVGGHIFGAATFGNLNITADAQRDAYVAKYDTNGTAMWVEKQATDGQASVLDLVSDDSGNVYVLSHFTDTLSVDTFTFNGAAAAAYSYCVAKYDSSGAVLWAKEAVTSNSYGGPSINVLYRGYGGIDLDSAGDVIVTGSFVGSVTINAVSENSTSWWDYDMFLAKLDGADGSTTWLRKGGGSNYDGGSDVIVADNQKIYVTGRGQNSLLFGGVSLNPNQLCDFVVEYSNSGNALDGAYATNSTSVFTAMPGVDVDSVNKVYMTSGYQNTLTIDGHSITAASGTDMYALRYDFVGDSLDYIYTSEDDGAGIGNERAYGIKVLESGDVYSVGHFNSDMDWGNNTSNNANWDGFLLKIADCDGLMASASTIGGDSICSGESVTLQADTDAVYVYQWLFNGATVGGQINETYTVSAGGEYSVVIDSAGCIDTSNVITVVVNALPTVTHANLASVCEADDPFLLTGGNPAGGTYSGTGVIGGDTFDPSIAALGNNIITYTYTDGNGCADSVTKTITVQQSPAIFNTTITACENDAPTSLAGSAFGFPVGGTHSGPGVVGTTFDPSVAGAGVHTITYASTNGCVSPDSITATVTATPNASLGAFSNLCVTNNIPVALTGGTPAGGTYGPAPYVLSGFFYTLFSGVGTHDVIYTVTNNGCSDSDTSTITVDPAATANISTLPDLCEGDDTLLLTSYGTPVGGTFSGTGVSSNIFDPAVSGTGTFNITYSFTNACGTATDNEDIDVNDLPTVSITSTDVSCNGGNDGSATATGSGTLAPFTYAWSTGVNNATSSNLTAGTYTVTVTDDNTCSDTGSVVIDEPTALSVNATGNSTTCNGGNDGIASAFASGGTPGYTYAWSSGGNSSIETGLTAGTYTVTVTDANGCTETATTTITEPTAVVASISGTNISCNGENDGSATASATGGTGAYTYAWSGGSGNSATASNLTAGTYTVTVTDANGCTDTEQVTITEPTPVVASIGAPTNVSCFGGNDGSATASGAGGTPNYTYAWSGGGGNSATASNLTAGTYTVTVTDANGCTDTEQVTITEPATAVSASIGAPTNVSCNGGNDGAAAASGSGGAPGYTFAWSGGGGNSATASGLTAGTYTVTVTDANGCTDTESVTITEPTPVVASIGTPTNISCNGGNDGAATASASGGTAGYTFAWSGGGGTNATASGLNAGTYTVTVTDANGCTDTESVTITEPAVLIAITVVDSNVSCNGLLDGGATASATGGTAAYSYSWNTGAITASITGLGANTYSVTVTDANGCTDSTSVTIIESAPIVASIGSPTNVSCFGGNDGSATASGSGGTPNYSYAWSGGVGNSATASGLTAGTYTVTVTDANGCTDTEQVTITQPATAVAAAIGTPTNVSCNGGNDGSATASGSGGTPGYSFAWSGGGGNSATASGLTAGTYTVTVTDANGCTDTESVTIIEPTPVVVSIGTPTNVSCNGGNDGAATASASGGTAGYTFAWSGGGGTNATASGLSAGTYTVTVTDANGCTDTESVTITEPAVLVAATVVDSNVSCNGGNDGGATASASGGTAAYSYSWNNGATTASISGLIAGTYSVTVTDANGCTDSTSVTITEPTLLIAATALDSNVSCNGGNDGGATASASGGTAAYSFAWSNGQNTASATGLTAGTFTVTVADANGCTDTASITINEPTLLVSSAVVDSNISCNGGNDGGATASASGGTAGYSFAWNNGASTASISGVTAGTYSVTITDANGCTDSSSVTITEPTLLVSSAVVDSNVSCNGGNDGGATASASGGTAGYSFAWSNLATTASITGVAAGTYSVTITDANGCTDSSSVTITEPAVLIAATVVDSNVSCNGGNDGGATASASGGTAAYSYSWNNGATTASITGLIAGTYSVTVTDANGCTDSTSVTITEPTVLIAATALDSNVSCNGGNDGGATASASGGTAAYSFTWSNGQNTASATGLTAGTFTVTVTDANGCTDTASITINEPTLLVATATTTSTTSCAASATGTGTASALGGTPSYSFNWSSGGNTANVIGLSAGTHTVTITDANGCTSTDTLFIDVNDTVLPTVVVNSVTLQLSTNGTAILDTGDVNNGSFDNCGIDTMYLSKTDFDCSDVGINSVTLTVVDINGNMDSAVATITVSDTVAPVISANDDSVYLDINGMVSIDLNIIGASASDSCGIDSTWLSDTTFNCLNTGINVVMVYAQDVNGNFDSTSIQVKVLDTIAPTIVALDDTLYLDATGTATTSAISLDIGTSDACGISSLSLNDSVFVCADTGLNLIQFYAQDVNGNIDSVQLNVWVYDTLSPEAIPFAELDVYLDSTGNVSITALQADSASTDNCLVDSTSISQSQFDCGDVGANSIAFTALDESGNVDVTNMVINVFDTIAPVVNTNDITVYLDSTGNITITTVQIDSNSQDNCGIASMALNQSLFTCANIGVNTVTLTVTDNNGNVDSSAALVTVLDTLTNVAITVDSIISCFGSNDAQLTAEGLGMTGAFTFNWSNSSTSATINGLGADTYTVTATSANGCTAVDSVEIFEPTALSGLLTAKDLSCFNSSDGHVVVNASGGTIPLSYAWNTGAITDSIGGLDTGYYTVVVSDSNGCQLTLDTTLQQPDSLQVAMAFNDSSLCMFDSSGIASVAIVGGTMPYSISWVGFANTNDTLMNIGAGTYTAIVTDTNLCVAIDSQTIVEDTLPNVALNLPLDTICQSIPLGITGETPVGGIFSGVGVVGDTLLTDSLQNWTTIEYNYVDGNGCAGNAEDSVFVIPILEIEFFQEEIVLCGGDVIALDNATPTGGIYNGDPSVIDTAAMLIIAPEVAFSDIVTYSFTNTCGSDTDTFSLVVNENPAVDLGDDINLCNNSLVTLDAGTHTSYEWYDGSSNPTIVLNGGETPIEEDVNVWVEVSDSAGCIGSDTVFVNVDAVQTFYLGDNIEACIKDSVTLSVDDVYDNFTWSTGETGLSIVAHDGSSIFPTSYPFWVTGTNNEGGCTYTDTIYVTFRDCDSTFVGTDEMGIIPISFELYPNPTRSIINLRGSSMATSIDRIEVYNINGELANSVEAGNFSLNDRQEIQLDLRSLDNGVYLIRISHELGVNTSRIILAH